MDYTHCVCLDTAAGFSFLLITKATAESEQKTKTLEDEMIVNILTS